MGSQGEQRDYVVEQLVQALGGDWARENPDLIAAYCRAIVELGYTLPDEPPLASEEEAA